jgi:hypothetical protein
MSQNDWKNPGENENKNHSSYPRNGRDRFNVDGFEGMNFEQRRQPFNPEDAQHTKRNTIKRDEGKAPHQP